MYDISNKGGICVMTLQHYHPDLHSEDKNSEVWEIVVLVNPQMY